MVKHSCESLVVPNEENIPNLKKSFEDLGPIIRDALDPNILGP